MRDVGQTFLKDVTCVLDINNGKKQIAIIIGQYYILLFFFWFCKTIFSFIYIAWNTKFYRISTILKCFIMTKFKILGLHKKPNSRKSTNRTMKFSATIWSTHFTFDYLIYSGRQNKVPTTYNFAYFPFFSWKMKLLYRLFWNIVR